MKTPSVALYSCVILFVVTLKCGVHARSFALSPHFRSAYNVNLDYTGANMGYHKAGPGTISSLGTLPHRYGRRKFVGSVLSTDRLPESAPGEDAASVNEDLFHGVNPSALSRSLYKPNSPVVAVKSNVQNQYNMPPYGLYVTHELLSAALLSLMPYLINVDGFQDLGYFKLQRHNPSEEGVLAKIPKSVLLDEGFVHRKPDTKPIQTPETNDKDENSNRFESHTFHFLTAEGVSNQEDDFVHSGHVVQTLPFKDLNRKLSFDSKTSKEKLYAKYA